MYSMKSVGPRMEGIHLRDLDFLVVYLSGVFLPTKSFCKSRNRSGMTSHSCGKWVMTT